MRFALPSLSRVAALAALSLAGCGGSSSTPLYGPGVCNPNTPVQLASPQSGATAVNTSTGSVVIVAQNNTNTLYYTYSQWYLSLTGTNGQTITSGALNLTPNNGYPKPYDSDFYYSGSISGLVSGNTYSVKLIQSGISCTPVTVGSFST